ncbi:MAG: peptide deformylase [Clostridiales bacterium]|nr:peptide deformylase [Clostridiales bacterium]
MALRNIVTEGDPILRKVCRPVGEVTPRIQMILDDMVETMRDANGVGLAAPQVGIMRRMFVAEPEPERVYIFVDPEMVTLEGEQESNEGCLSVPGYVGTVKRPEKIVIRGKDRYGKEKEYTFEGFDAVVMCHEFDHLEGILYTDKATEVFSAEELETEEQDG